MKNPYLIGENIYLRPLEKGDAPVVQPWFNDPEVNRFMPSRHPINLQAEEKFIDHVSASESDLVLLIVRSADDHILGASGFHQISFRNRNAVFGITIGDKDQWGKGHGTEATELMMKLAFDSLNLHRVTLQVFEYNKRAIRIYEKLGFQKEGVLRQENFREGRYWDTVVMGLLREEWATDRSK